MKKVSFIIIGRNEGWKLELVLKSVFDSILLNNIVDVSEVIYVDSNSNDNSIEIASKFPLTHIIKITDSHYNAAVGRNLGASYSYGETLIFLDGDMQLEPSFISEIIDDDNSLKYDFVSGNIQEFYYDEKWQYLKKAFKTPDGNAYSKDKDEVSVGGLFFVIKRSLWDKLKGMDNTFKVVEDIDFSLRLSQKGIKLLRKKEVAATHHTISYTYSNRLKKDLLSFNSKYYGLLYRKHLLNKKLFKKIARSEFTLFFLLFLSLLSIFISSIWPISFYPIFIFFRSWYHSRKRFYSFWDILNIPIRDLTVFFSFLFFFPKKRSYNHQHLILQLKKDYRIL
jgi:glycosyltransferase involved in cell wall biosynthesis